MPTLAYRVEGKSFEDPATNVDIITPRVIWDRDTVNISADEAVGAASGSALVGRARDAAQVKVQTFLLDILKNGALPQKRIEEEAAREGFSHSQLRTAKEKLGVISEKSGQGAWMWRCAF